MILRQNHDLMKVSFLHKLKILFTVIRDDDNIDFIFQIICFHLFEQIANSSVYSLECCIHLHLQKTSTN